MALASGTNSQDGGRATAVQNRFLGGEARCPLQKGGKKELDGGRRVYSCSGPVPGRCRSLPGQDGLMTLHQVAEPTFCSEPEVKEA
jgi:hypothetical protein